MTEALGIFRPWLLGYDDVFVMPRSFLTALDSVERDTMVFFAKVAIDLDRLTSFERLKPAKNLGEQLESFGILCYFL